MFPADPQSLRIRADPDELHPSFWPFRHRLFRLAFHFQNPQHGKLLRNFSYSVNTFLKEKLQFAERLRSLRDERNLTNLDLGKSVGLSHVSIGNFLEGQLPKSEHLVALARFFGVTTDWLLGREPEPTRSVLRENPPGYLLDDALAELEALKEQVQSLDRALRRLKEQGDNTATGGKRRTAENDRKTGS
jgi:transcriptional regulator with XRE-family HTH domain